MHGQFLSHVHSITVPVTGAVTGLVLTNLVISRLLESEGIRAQAWLPCQETEQITISKSTYLQLIYDSYGGAPAACSFCMPSSRHRHTSVHMHVHIHGPGRARRRAGPYWPGPGPLSRPLGNCTHSILSLKCHCLSQTQSSFSRVDRRASPWNCFLLSSLGKSKNVFDDMLLTCRHRRDQPFHFHLRWSSS